MKKPIALAMSAALILMALGACGGTAESACRQAFAAAQNEIGGGLGLDALDPAIRACATVDEWRAAWEAFPKSHGSAVDPIVFLQNRCFGEVALAGTALCKSAPPIPQ